MFSFWSHRASRTADPALGTASWWWSVLFAVMLVAGGTNETYFGARVLAQICGVMLVMMAVASRHSALPRLTALDAILLAGLALVVLHSVPLPPGIWTLHPFAEHGIAIDRQLLGEPGWRSWNLAPENIYGLLAFGIPGSAAYFAWRTGDSARRRSLIKGAFAAGLIAVLLGLAQAGAGPDSALYPFTLSNRAFSIGFFTNHNHQATFLAMLVPLAAIYLGASHAGALSGSVRQSVALAAVAVLAMIGVLLSGSRAGLVVAGISILLTAAVWLRALPEQGQGKGQSMERWSRLMRRVAGGTALAALAGLFALPFLRPSALSAVSERSAVLADRRFDIWAQSFELMQRSFPGGTGFGTFQDIFAMNEPLETVGQKVINHAHNDYLELAIEGGLPAIALFLLLALWTGRRMWRVWQHGEKAEDGGASFERPDACLFAGVILVIPALHSLVDYPLRTHTVSAMALLALGIIVQGKPGRRIPA